MARLMWLWLKKTVSDFHNAVISVIVTIILTTALLGNLIKSTKNVLLWKQELWKSIVISLSILLLYEIVLQVRLFLAKRNEYFEYFGIYWDKESNALCPKCKFKLIENTEHFKPNEFTALCGRCDWEEKLKDTTGKTFRIEEAKECIERLRKHR